MHGEQQHARGCPGKVGHEILETKMVSRPPAVSELFEYPGRERHGDS
jgi:hypothetical protein